MGPLLKKKLFSTHGRYKEDFKSVFKKIAREHISDLHCKCTQTNKNHFLYKSLYTIHNPVSQELYVGNKILFRISNRIFCPSDLH